MDEEETCELGPLALLLLLASIQAGRGKPDTEIQPSLSLDRHSFAENRSRVQPTHTSPMKTTMTRHVGRQPNEDDDDEV